MVFQHSGAQDFDLGGGFHYSGSYPMVFQHSGAQSDSGGMCRTMRRALESGVMFEFVYVRGFVLLFGAFAASRSMINDGIADYVRAGPSRPGARGRDLARSPLLALASVCPSRAHETCP